MGSCGPGGPSGCPPRPGRKSPGTAASASSRGARSPWLPPSGRRSRPLANRPAGRRGLHQAGLPAHRGARGCRREHRRRRKGQPTKPRGSRGYSPSAAVVTGNAFEGPEPARLGRQSTHGYGFDGAATRCIILAVRSRKRATRPLSRPDNACATSGASGNALRALWLGAMPMYTSAARVRSMIVPLSIRTSLGWPSMSWVFESCEPSGPF